MGGKNKDRNQRVLNGRHGKKQKHGDHVDPRGVIGQPDFGRDGFERNDTESKRNRQHGQFLKRVCCVDRQKNQQPQRQKEVIKATPACRLDQCAKARNHQRQHDDIQGCEGCHKHQAQHRDHQRDDKENNAAFYAFVTVFHAEEPFSIGATGKRRSRIGKGQNRNRQDIEVKVISGQKQAEPHGNRQKQIAIRLPFDPVQRPAQFRIRQAQHHHHNQGDPNQRIDRPAIRKQPRQAKRIKSGADMNELALHLGADLPLGRQPAHYRHQTQQRGDRPKSQSNLENRTQPITSSTTKSE